MKRKISITLFAEMYAKINEYFNIGWNYFNAGKCMYEYVHDKIGPDAQVMNRIKIGGIQGSIILIKFQDDRYYKIIIGGVYDNLFHESITKEEYDQGIFD